jgi:hypothetical protein
MKYVITLMAITMAAGMANADVAPTVIRDMGSVGVVYVMCDAEADDDTDCGAADEIVADVAGFSSITFYSTRSTATTYTCNVMSNALGHDAVTGDGFDVSATPLSDTQEAITLSGPFSYVWVTCGTITGGNVTVDMLGQRSK